MTLKVTRILSALMLILVVPAAAYAQATITGVVRDTSGAVLPGVTVEAASPALIEKVRSAVTDGTGQYRIVDLRPGAYTVTFTLPGFSTVKREGVELTGSFTATINADMRVGALEETITVTGETPIVDVQSATRQRVVDRDIIDSVPSARAPYTLAVLIPGVTLAGTQDVGGSQGSGQFPVLQAHGSRRDAQRVMQNGVSLGTIVSDGSVSAAAPNVGAYQEVQIDYAAGSAEIAQGGVRLNYIPREGGNTFSSSMFASFANGAMQSSNLSKELQDRGLRTPDSMKKNWDINPAFGGPIKRDRLWFYTTVRHNGAQNYVAGMFYNKNANNPNAWTYEPDLSRRASQDNQWRDAQARLTWQATAKNKIGFTYNQQDQCFCLTRVDALTSPEAGWYWYFPLQRMLHADWTSPLTNRLLLDAVVFQRAERFIMERPRDLNPLMISVTEQSSGLTYRARGLLGIQTYANGWTTNVYYRAGLTYVTGAHAVKIGLTDGMGIFDRLFFDNQPISFRFNNGVPNQIGLGAVPFRIKANVNHDLGLYAQDKWTINRLTLTFGARYDHFSNSFPEQHLGPALLTPTRELRFPEQSNVSYHDVTPRSAASYDLFGNGKTAVKVSLNKYVAGLAVAGLGSEPNPVNRLVLRTTRSWVDADRDFVPDCELTNPDANGECGAMANRNFGREIPGATFDPELMRGWGSREYNWEFSAGVQHEIVPRVSVDLGYFRRWYGNFRVIDNLTLTPADFDPFSITAPTDPRLPNGGGYVISGLYDLKPAKFGLPANNFNTLADKYGKQIDHWNGVDLSVNMRLPNGLMAQGGFSTGKTTTDNCEVVAKLDNPSQRFCRVETPFLTQVKGFGAYTIPRIDVRISGAFQSLPGPQILANFNAPNSAVVPSLGRNLAGGAANVTVNLVEPGSMYGERLNQLDLRVAKLLRFGRTRTALNLDLYNALNANPVLALNNNFAAWQRPTSILVARFARVGVQVDF